MPYLLIGTGRERKSDDESQTSGTPAVSGSFWNCTPWIVSFEAI